MFSTFDRIFTFAINAITFVVAIIVTAIFWFTATYFFADIAIYIPITILGAIAGIILGAYLNVLLSIPFNLSKKYDVIKNKVALKQYQSVADFQNDIALFLHNNFSYPGATIDAGLYRFKGAENLTMNLDFDLEQLSEVNQQNPVKKLNGYKAFYIQVTMGDESLGDMILLSKGFTLPIMYSMLMDFENYMLDDQLLHVQHQCT